MMKYGTYQDIKDNMDVYRFKKKVNFLLFLCSTEVQKAQPNLILGSFSFDLTFAVCLLGITLGETKFAHRKRLRIIF